MSVQYLLPGFINCHVHFSLNAGKHPTNDMAITDACTLTTQGVQLAARLLKAGVTTVRDMGDKHFELLALRNAINSGMLEGPTILAPGQALLMAGGFDTSIGLLFEGECGETAEHMTPYRTISLMKHRAASRSDLASRKT